MSTAQLSLYSRMLLCTAHRYTEVFTMNIQFLLGGSSKVFKARHIVLSMFVNNGNGSTLVLLPASWQI